MTEQPPKRCDVPTLLDEIVRRLRAALDPERIYLFDSYAYGIPTRQSDLDLLVVVPTSPLDFLERTTVAIRALDRIGAPIDVMVYTREEFERRSALRVSFERTVRTKGRLLYAA